MRRTTILFHLFMLLGIVTPQVILAQSAILDERITITFSNETVKEALTKISDQTGYVFSYASSDVNKTRRVNQKFVNAPLKEVIRFVWGEGKVKLFSLGSTIEILVVETQEKSFGDLRGYLTDDNNEPVPFAMVAIKGTRKGVITDESGKFQIKGIPEGSHVIAISSLGYGAKEQGINIKSNEITTVDIKVLVSVQSLEEVVVEGKSFTQEMAEKPIAISTINTSMLQGQTQDVAKVLDKVEGVRIRQSGGLGSAINISINGLTGNAIRFYYNGIPSEFLGGGFQLNTLPISNVDRIEVYKGVMPANIGTDALGGGINVATNTDGIKKVDLSYQFGSFNTHRAAASITRPMGDSWFINVNVNYNYSDNDYKMEVENNIYDASFPLPTGKETITVRRFHDAFSAFLGNMLLGYSNEDKGLSFRIGAYITASDRDLQHGVRVSFVPIGEFRSKSQDSYLKADVEKKISDNWILSYSGIGGYSRAQIRDSTRNLYDWYGRIVSEINPSIDRNNGAELLGRPSISDINSYNAVQRFGSTFDLPYNISLSLHHFFAYQKRQGSEELEINYIAGEDPLEEGFRITRNITSLELKKLFFAKKLEVLSTVKSYRYSTEGVNTLVRDRNTRTDLPIVTNNELEWGFNLAAKWNVTEKLFLRTSFEDAVRIPTQNEIFGNLGPIIPNFSIRPERSRNLNLDLNADISSFLKANFSYFIRSQRDLIVLQPIDVETARFINRNKVYSSGVEISLRGTLAKKINYTWNTTYFNIEISEVSQQQDEFLIGSPVPNIPTFFSNLGLTYLFEDAFKKENNLQFNIDVQFVDEFSFIQDGNIRNDANWIPVQFAVDAGFTYKIKDNLSFNFQANNVFDTALFDFVSVPKPGRNFAAKVRYNF
ncbi:MAG: TonB-dependent receptor [Bacteroidota bacterium]